MENYLRQQFDHTFSIIAESFVERCVQRSGGSANAIAGLKNNPEGEGIWLSQYVDAAFQDWLWDNPAGAAFVLENLSRRNWPSVESSGDVATVLIASAKAAFAELLCAKVIEAIERQMVMGG